MKTIIASCDTGNKNIRVYVEGMPEPVIIPNSISPASVHNTSIDINMFSQRLSNPLNLLDVTLITNEKNMGRRYVGGLSIRHGGEVRALAKQKYNDEEILYGAITSIAQSLCVPGAEKKYQIYLGTCLPINEYIRTQCVEAHEKRFLGTHKVIFHNAYYKNAIVNLEILEGNILTYPEGTSALINIMTDNDGNINEEYIGQENRIYLVVDIGGSTTDIMAIMNFEPVEELISFMNQGILYAEEKIIETLKRIRPHYYIGKNDLDYSIRKRNCHLIDGENEWDISGIVNEEFRNFARNISMSLNDTIQRIPPAFKKNIARIIFTGGASLLLSDHIKEELKGLITGMNGVKILFSPSSLYDNVLGCYKAVKKLYTSKAKVESEVYEKEVR